MGCLGGGCQSRPGTEAAYTAAAAARERIDDTWQGERLFPGRRVVAGWDFAGPLYDPDCTPVAERSGLCSPTPAPDPDPLDVLGHGTHVAGIAAGQETGMVGPGVAPGAAVVALKIFGSSVATELLLDAMEWAIEANMGLGSRPHLDVLNLSLGVPYGGRLLAQEGVLRRAVAALMATGIGVSAASQFEARPTVDIPVWMVNGALEQAILGATADGRSVSLALSPQPRPELAGVVSPFSSRAPGRLANLKPNLSAPGSGIFAAAVGQGRRGISASGTSQAAPHVAGTAALVWATARQAGHALTARQVAALLVTTAEPAIPRASSEHQAPAPLARVGAGALDAWAPPPPRR